MLIARFSPFLRAIVPFVAGTLRLRISVFLFYSIVGGLAWACSARAAGLPCRRSSARGGPVDRPRRVALLRDHGGRRHSVLASPPPEEGIILEEQASRLLWHMLRHSEDAYATTWS